jgi:hypothetical protein
MFLLLWSALPMGHLLTLVVIPQAQHRCCQKRAMELPVLVTKRFIIMILNSLGVSLLFLYAAISGGYQLKT